MSYFAELQAAATEAQGVLAQMQGMGAGAAGNFTIEDHPAPYVGVLRETRDEMRLTVGPLESVRQLVIVATRSQFTLAPDAAKRPKVVARSRNWELSAVSENELAYTLTCTVAD